MGLDIRDLELNLYYRTWFCSGLSHILRCDPVKDRDLQSGTENGIKGTHFPEPWHSILQQITPPVDCLFTYWEMPYDLSTSSQPKSERCSLFNRIIEALDWPRGKIVFWPATCLHNSECYFKPDIFWEGVEQLQPTYLICFGKTVFRSLFPGEAPNQSQFSTYNNINVLHLAGPNDMLPDNREAKRRVWQTLKNLKLY